MKLNYKKALKIKQDFQHLVGQKVKTKEGENEIRELVVLPLVDGTFGTFPLNYLMATDKSNFITPYLDKEMSIIIYFTDNSFAYFFQYLQDNNINLDWTKYIND